MHNLAIALKRKGYLISGSDDAIYDPAASNLRREELLPTIGWDASRITKDIDQIILGMHAREDNPELIRARELKIPILSFPEFIAQESSNKKRVVIAGSHGKTTTTSMIMFALKHAKIEFDYLVGSSIEGFDLSVQLSDAPLIIIEGDEYLSSPIDRRPKFMWYDPDISIITGIAYDHINVFPTYDSYLKAFKDFIDMHRPESKIYWFEGDEELPGLVEGCKTEAMPYGTPNYTLENQKAYFQFEEQSYPLSLVGEHNLQNLEAARKVCLHLGLSSEQFLNSMQEFEGAGKRMDKIYEQEGQVVYRDFAHSPSKLKATTKAIKNTYTARPLSAFFELHTFSSLNEEFLPLYNHCMDSADEAFVFVDPHVFEYRKREPLKAEFIQACFGDVRVFTSAEKLKTEVDQAFKKGNNVLLMSSGTFGKSEFDFS